MILFSWNNFGFGQKIIEYKGDTLVAITPENLATINSIIVERDYLEEELFILSELTALKDSTIKEQNEIIKVRQDALCNAYDTYYNSKKTYELALQDQAVTWKKEVFKWSGIMTGIGFILGVIIAK